MQTASTYVALSPLPSLKLGKQVYVSTEPALPACAAPNSVIAVPALTTASNQGVVTGRPVLRACAALSTVFAGLALITAHHRHQVVVPAPPAQRDCAVLNTVIAGLARPIASQRTVAPAAPVRRDCAALNMDFAALGLRTVALDARFAGLAQILRCCAVCMI